MCNGVKSNSLSPYFFVFMMAFTGGFADAASFILLGVFSGHVTGNSVLSLIWVIEGNYSKLFTSVAALLGFIVGTFGGIVWRKNIQQTKNMYQALIFQLILVTAVFMVRNTWGETAASTLIFTLGLSCTLGVQNGFYMRVGNTSVHTTYITGISTSLVEALLYTKKTKSDRNFSKKIFAILMSAFVFGAGVGALMSYHFGLNGFMLIIPLISISAVVCFFYLRE